MIFLFFSDFIALGMYLYLANRHIMGILPPSVELAGFAEVD